MGKAVQGKKWTLAEIRAANENAGHFFFSRDTMRFFGDTMRSFSVRHVDGRVYVVRVAPTKHKTGLGDWREFNPDTGDIGLPTQEPIK